MRIELGDPSGTPGQLRHWHEPFPYYVDALPIILWRSSPDGSCFSFNRRWTQYTGLEGVIPAQAGVAQTVHPDDVEQVAALARSAWTRQSPFEAEFRLRRRDGSYGWVRVQGNPCLQAQGQSEGYVGTALEITARDIARPALESSEARLRYALHVAGGAEWVWNPRTGDIQFDKNTAAMLGYQGDTLSARDLDWFDIIHPLDRHIVDELRADYVAGRLTEHLREVRMRCGNGQYKWISSRGQAVGFDAAGLPLRVLGVHVDVTGLRETAEQLRSREALLMLAMNAAQMGWYIRDLGSDIGIGSPSLASIYGLDNPTGPWALAEIRSRILPEDLPLHLEDLRRALELPVDPARLHVVNYRIRRTDGEIRHLEARYRLERDFEHQRAVGIVVDITRQKETEFALRQADARLEVALEHANMAWFEREITSGEMRGSRSLWRIYGIDPAQVPLNFDDILPLIHPEDRAIYPATPEQLFDRGNLEGDKKNCLQYRVRQPSGEYRWVEVRYRVVVDSTSGSGCVYGLVIDVSAAKRVESALRESEARLRLALETVQMASWQWDIDGNLLTSADSLSALFSLPTRGPWTPDEALVNVDEADRRRISEAVGRIRKGLERDLNVEFRIALPDGGARWVEVRGYGELGLDGRAHGMIGVALDVTERRVAEVERGRLQNQLQQAQKMEAIGLLTGGIAHDFNNILGSILGYTGLALSRFGTALPHKLVDYLNEVQAAGERARDLISQMLAFSRGEPGEAVLTDVVTLVRNAVKMLRPTLPASIEMHVSAAPDLPQVALDPVQIQQVLVNLCINARDAIEGRGNIWITIDVRTGTVGDCSSCHARFHGNFLALAVADDGPGIADNVRARIFDPFFSTKAIGQGTGMGLAMSHGILHRHSGHVIVGANEPHGARFEVLLPCEQRVRVLPRRNELIDVTPVEDHSSQHILVVDDEEAIGRFVGELLEHNGYRVTVEYEAQLALERIRREPAAYDLLLSDQTMPRMTGGQLATEVMALRPDLPVIMMTGYSTSMDEKRARELGIRTYLRKPLRGDLLLAAIRRLLDPQV